MAHSIRGWTCGWQIKLCDPSLTRAILGALGISFVIKRYKNLRRYIAYAAVAQRRAVKTSSKILKNVEKKFQGR